jgi:hypothetical protein
MKAVKKFKLTNCYQCQTPLVVSVLDYSESRNYCLMCAWNKVGSNTNADNE